MKDSGEPKKYGGSPVIFTNQLPAKCFKNKQKNDAVRLLWPTKWKSMEAGDVYRGTYPYFIEWEDFKVRMDKRCIEKTGKSLEANNLLFFKSVDGKYFILLKI